MSNIFVLLVSEIFFIIEHVIQKESIYMLMNCAGSKWLNSNNNEVVILTHHLYLLLFD